MIFINTRPQSRSHLLSHSMQEYGLEVIDLPLLEISPLTITQHERDYQQILLFGGHKDDYKGSYKADHKINYKDGYQALVVISPSAAKLGLVNCPNGFVPHCPVIAVGEATADVLRQAGWQPSCPIEANNEGMIQMLDLAELGTSDAVLIWRGQGGRRLLVNHLQDKGVQVDAIAWYQRHCPTELSTHFQAIQSHLLTAKPHKPIVLISSGQALGCWQSVIQSADGFGLSDFNYLGFGTRLCAMLDDLAVSWTGIDGLDPDAVWAGVSSFHKS